MRVTFPAVVAVSVLMAAAGRAQAADVQVGPRFSVSDDADLGVGGDVRVTILDRDPRLAITGSFDYFFPDDGSDDIEDALGDLGDLLPGDFDLPFDQFLPDTDVSYWEANLNLTWDFTNAATVVPYAGAGVNYARAKVSAFGFSTDESDIGANVLAGMRIQNRFYMEAKYEAGGGELFVLTVGVRF
jgi:hypothetical protein